MRLRGCCSACQQSGTVFHFSDSHGLGSTPHLTLSHAQRGVSKREPQSCPLPTLRDAALRAAPQGEVVSRFSRKGPDQPSSRRTARVSSSSRTPYCASFF